MKNQHQMNIAQIYMSTLYNKILLVRLKSDTFVPILVDDSELLLIDYGTTFSEWVREFGISPYCHPEDSGKFLEFMNIDTLRKLNKPEFFTYRKMIKGSYCRVLMEILPIGSECFYVYIMLLE